MSFLNENEKLRLLRLLPGTNPDDLVEELFAMASDKQRTEFPYGIDVTSRNPLLPGITADFGPDVPSTLFRANRGGFSFDLQLNLDGSLSINDGVTGDQISSGSGGGGGGGGGGSMPGQIVSYVGANVYNVRIYPAGLSGSSSVVSVTQLDGDPASPHADGSNAIVIRAGSSYYMRLPVWA